MTGFEKVFHLLKRDEKKTGSDYTATVTRTNKGIAYVQIAGAEIDDTPVAMSVDAKPGDQVRVRINAGKAWITGNDTRPPTNDSAKIEETEEQIKNVDQQIKAISDSLKLLLPKSMSVKRAAVYDQEVALINGNNRIALSMPNGLQASLGVHIDLAWPLSTWTDAYVTICRDGTTDGGGDFVNVYSGSAQSFRLKMSILYI